MKRFLIICAIVLAVLALAPIAIGVVGRAYVAARLRTYHPEIATKSAPLPNGGRLNFHGVKILNSAEHHGRQGFVWDGSYSPPGGAPEEFVGSFIGERVPDVTTAVGRGLVMVIPGNWDLLHADRIFVRSARGHWWMASLKLQDLTDGLDPPTLSSYLTSLTVEDLRAIKTGLALKDGQLGLSCFLNHFLANRAEFQWGCSANNSGGELLLRLADDGEHMELAEMKKYSFPK